MRRIAQAVQEEQQGEDANKVGGGGTAEEESGLGFRTASGGMRGGGTRRSGKGETPADSRH
jgi:hypothetical protein